MKLWNWLKKSTIWVEGKKAEAYIRSVQQLLELGRLNYCFPDPQRIRDYLCCLNPTAGFFKGFNISRQSGLPVYQSLFRVQLLWEKANSPSASGSASLAPLTDTRISPLRQTQVELRNREGNISFWKVVHDRFDIAEEVFVRYSLLVSSHTPLWKKEWDRELASLLQTEAELSWILISEKMPLQLEEIARGRIGPLRFSGLELAERWGRVQDGGRVQDPQLRDSFNSLFKDSKGYVLELSLDKASIHLQQNQDKDPFASLYSESLSPESRTLYNEKVGNLGYKIFKDRKFVCTPELKEPLTKLIQSIGAQSIVYA